ncbi:MAG: YgjP-like metallopeptidase domain-containing protein [Clostridia bacterium]
MSILKQKNSNIIDLRKPVDIKTYLTVSVLGKSLNLNIKYKKIDVPELYMGENDVNIYLPMRYKENGTVEIVSEAIKKMYNEIAEIEIANSMEKIRVMLGFAPENYEIKRMKDSFIKNNRDKTIEINPDIVKYSRKIIETSLIQAFCKTRHKEGSKEYRDLLQKSVEKYENYQYKVISAYKRKIVS